MRRLRLNSIVFQYTLTSWHDHSTINHTAAVILFIASTYVERCVLWMGTWTVWRRLYPLSAVSMHVVLNLVDQQHSLELFHHPTSHEQYPIMPAPFYWFVGVWEDSVWWNNYLNLESIFHSVSVVRRILFLWASRTWNVYHGFINESLQCLNTQQFKWTSSV